MFQFIFLVRFLVFELDPRTPPLPPYRIFFTKATLDPKIHDNYIVQDVSQEACQALSAETEHSIEKKIIII